MEQVATYVTPEQKQRWKKKADERNMSFSEWVECMVEAGQKKFTNEIVMDESVRELRRERNDLRLQLKAAQERIDELEQALDADAE